MNKVYLLQHTYGPDESGSFKLIGLYSSKEKAELAIGRLIVKPGFRDWPDGFLIDEWEMDKDEWTEGFGE